MKLIENSFIQKAFGGDAKWIDLKERGLKGILFRSNSYKLSRYDEIHMGRFISSGIYEELLKHLHKVLGPNNRLLIEVEYSILKLCVIRKGKNKITVLKRFSIGLFYDRTFEELCEKSTKCIKTSLLNNISTNSQAVKHFFETFKVYELDSIQKRNDSIALFEQIANKTLSKSEEDLIINYTDRELL